MSRGFRDACGLPIGEAMSNPTDLDVSKEEQRFLRRTFHRIALPYAAVLGAALALLAWSGSDGTAVDSSEELAALRIEIDALRSGFDEIGAAAKRAELERAATSRTIGALQGQLSAGSGGELVALERAVDAARKRIAEVESRLVREAATERFNALGDRITRLERDASPVSEPAAPAPPKPGPAATPPPASRDPL